MIVKKDGGLPSFFEKKGLRFWWTYDKLYQREMLSLFQ